MHRFRRMVVILAGIAWFGISNHCALAALEGTPSMPVPSCHKMAPLDRAPAKHDHESTGECCKVLRATLLTPSGSLAAYNAFTSGTQDFVVALVSASDDLQRNPVIERDTGPPGADSFAESVLQRSILAHAPPSLV